MADQGNRARRTLSAAFKLEAVQRAAERRGTGVPVTQIARELGVTPALLRTWGRQAITRPGAPATDVFPGHGRLRAQETELRRLQRENHRLSQENAFLKTAAAYFARESQ